MSTFSKAGRVLGELETRVMDLLWEEHPVSVRTACERLRGDHAYTTIMTTMDRLHKKRLLRRKKDGNAFIYEPAMDRSEYQRRVVEAALSPLLEQGAAPVLAAFVEVAADLDEKHLAQLERLIASHRRRK
ncbi:MAG: BlaI/MecI/CopY family transcriptional regulator [Deltaproteobacteria bacterium]|nr:BlaI/MecI/CopY family transcriptional regulator [Deltaproteobacteria bacterium]MDQ3297081.1 BlaI/MecI/CopY family transcriptional regulator [Myxococcota bacterium]